MYEFNGFGLRLQKLRKAKGLTQEDLADRVGVTGQAVSKWENDQSYPDITIIPTLAEILGTDINQLFGKVTPAVQFSYPDTFEGLPLVHSTTTVACYSNKKVASKDDTGVKFEDGSTAELSNRLATNAGSGEIHFISGEDVGIMQQSNVNGYTETEKYFEFDPTVQGSDSDSMDITVLFNECYIKRSPDNRTRVRATGDPMFIHLLQAKLADRKLTVEFLQQDNNNFKGRYQDNKVTVEVPYNQGKHANFCVNGSGLLTSEIERFETGNILVNGSCDIDVLNFDTCNVMVNGSGDISAKDSAKLNISINGSGDVTFNNADEAWVSLNGSGDVSLGAASAINVSINGSGDVSVDEKTGDGNISIKMGGSGDISIGNGSCDKFHVDIAGSGDVDAAGITARIANITLHDSGSVTLGCVTESSTEQIKKKGKIKILKRVPMQ